jgi:hypothetical protein
MLFEELLCFFIVIVLLMKSIRSTVRDGLRTIGTGLVR